jgi:hypothetical protein
MWLTVCHEECKLLLMLEGAIHLINANCMIVTSYFADQKNHKFLYTCYFFQFFVLELTNLF